MKTNSLLFSSRLSLRIRMQLKVSNTATFKKLSFYQFSSSLLTYFLKSKTPSVIPFWRAFLMPMKGARSKVPLSGHFRWLSQCQDWFTKSGGHERSLKLETWNFAWDLISPIHMLCKKVGLIWEHFEKMVQPISNWQSKLGDILNWDHISVFRDILTMNLIWCGGRN